MASPAPAVPATSNLGSANPSGPSRTGWGSTSEPGAAFRGIGRATGRARGGRGGHRGGRSANGRGGATTNSDASRKSPQDQPKEKGPSVSPKAATTAPSSSPPTSSTQNNGSAKSPGRPKVARKASESKASRKPSLGVDPNAPPAPNSSSSAQISPRTPSRRKRSHASSKASQQSTNSNAPNLPRKPSLTVTAEPNNSRPAGGKASAAAPVKDLPPHLVPHSATAPTFDIRHDIDALVERVRAVAMDRPHTPGSHIDWAGDEDDSLPDLDDWGVTSPTTHIAPDSVKGSVISPILQDTLRPLPSVVDIDIPAPSIKLHEADGVHTELHVVPDAESVGEKTPQRVSGEGTPAQPPTNRVKLEAIGSSTETSIVAEPPTVQVSPPPSLPLHPPPAKSSAAYGASKTSGGPVKVPATSEDTAPQPIHSPTAKRPQPPADFFSAESSPSPDRGLAASIHAVSKSLSPPNHLRSPPYSFPHTPHGGFNPSHNRAQTVGRYRPDYLSDTDRPRRGDSLVHGRNHSTPPAGTGAVHSHLRSSSRPVITGDAISKLARTLGGTPLPKRDSSAAPAPTAKAN